MFALTAIIGAKTQQLKYGTGATQEESAMTFNSGAASVDTIATLNSLGQVLSRQKRIAPGGSTFDTVSYAYDTTGHNLTVSQPCQTSALGATCSTTGTSYTYDGLSRVKTATVHAAVGNGVLTYAYPNGDVSVTLSPAPSGESNKTTETEYDGLGRVTSVCQFTTTLGGYGSCNHRDSGAIGYRKQLTLDALGRATQISVNSQAGATPQNSTATYDMLSRLTQSLTPDSGTSYTTFDTTTSNCASSLAGHLTQTKDANGNINCYTYDSMGRLSTVTPAAGPQVAVSATKYFCYDGTITTQCQSFATNYLLGKLTYAGAVYSGTTISHVYGYDIYGRQTDDWSAIPSAHTTVSYWDHGMPATLSGLSSLGVPDWSFLPDSEGRPYASISGPSTTIVASVAYDNASNPLTVTYQNGDTDKFAYEASSQNMTQYQFSVGTGASNTDTGTLTWNKNGTLAKLVISDLLYPSDTQTCITGRDDIARITSWNCGSLWNTSYSYSANAFGNVSKSGSLNFTPGYSTSSNRMLAPYTYDTAGNLLHDATLGNNYNYDSFGVMYYQSGTTVYNDAFGRPAEVGTQGILYTPVGKLGTMTGSTINNLRFGQPGGGAYLYSGSSQLLEHYDFQGNVRLGSNYSARSLASAYAYGPSGEIYLNLGGNGVLGGASQDTTTGMFDFGADRNIPNMSQWTQPPYVKDNSPF